MKKLFFCIIPLLIILCSCSSVKSEYTDKTVFALDTVINISLGNGGMDDNANDKIMSHITEIIYDTENQISPYKTSSAIYAFNNSSSYDCILQDSDIGTMVTTALTLSDISGGKYDITALPLTTLWGIGDEDVDTPPGDDKIQSTLSQIDYTQLYFDNGVLKKQDEDIKIDVGSLGKGYLLDKITEYLSSSSLQYAMINAGGNVGVYGNKPDGSKWNIAVKSPYDTSKVVGQFSISSGYISVSGDYERYFTYNGKRYHHILDATTGYPVDNGVHSVAVWCDNATLGDGLSTLLFIMGPDNAQKVYEALQHDFVAVFNTDDGIVTYPANQNIFFESK